MLAWEDGCFGEKLCKNCEIPGREKKQRVTTIYACKLTCFSDPNCLGIDFGKNNRNGECFHNYERSFRADNSIVTIYKENFDAWQKLNYEGCNYRKFGMHNI